MLTAQQVLDYLLELQKTEDLTTLQVTVFDWSQTGDTQPSYIGLDYSDGSAFPKIVLE